MVEVLAVALNPLDLAVAAGRFYGGHPPFPYVPGLRGRRAHAGRQPRLRLRRRPGGRARRDARRARHDRRRPVVPVEEDVDDATAVALGIAGIIGWARSSADASARATGCSSSARAGRPGWIAIQRAKQRGAERIVAAGRDLGRLERARELGADEPCRSPATSRRRAAATARRS